MNPTAAFIQDALQWEIDRGFHGPRTLMESTDSLTLPDGTVVALKAGRIEVQRTPAAERQLTEAIQELHEQRPTSYAKTDSTPAPDPVVQALARGLDLSAYSKFKVPASAPKPAGEPPAAKTLSEKQLSEARAALYGSVRGSTAPAVAEGVHQRLFRAIKG